MKTFIIFSFVLFLNVAHALDAGFSNTEAAGRNSSGVGIVDNESSEFYLNPALTGTLKQYIVGTDYVFSGDKPGLVLTAVDGKSGALKAGLGYETRNGKSVAVNTAYPFGKRLALGITGSRNLDSRVNSLDAGAVVFITNIISAGLVSHDLYSSSHLDRDYTLGVNGVYPSILRLSLDYTSTKKLLSGLEIFLREDLFLRGGYEIMGDKSWSAGLSWRAPKIHFGYSFVEKHGGPEHWGKIALVM